MSEQMYSIVLIVGMFVIMYFFMVRPENKRKKEAEAMRNALAVGDEVTTISGLLGTVCAIKESSVVIETGADRVRVEVAKWAISNKGMDTASRK